MMHFRFLFRFLTKGKQIGALVPSSGFLARAIAAQIWKRSSGDLARGRSILEIGAGTGALTRGIVARLGRDAPQDWLTCVELDHAFATVLRSKMRAWKRAGKLQGTAELFEGNVLNFEPIAPYDWIVCGLPLNNFSPEFIEALARKSSQLLKADGHFVFFEYEKIRSMKRFWTRGEERARLDALDALFQRWVIPRRIHTEVVWWNVPPARIHVLRCTKDGISI